jgi:hypothetical protein
MKGDLMGNNAWSFCIVTSGSEDDSLREVITSIEAEFCAHPYEIIIIGNTKIRPNNIKIRVVEFNEEIFSLNISNFFKNVFKLKLKKAIYRTGWITGKKNLSVRLAQYENVCLMHDYVKLQPGWLSGFQNFTDDWLVCITKVSNKDGSRHRDWMTWDYPGVGAALLPYHIHVNYIYLSGAYFCVKKDFYLTNPLNEKLFWGEAEDVEWSCRVRNLTRFIINTDSSVTYTKLKPLNEAPYCRDWVSRSEKLIKLLEIHSENPST